MEDSFLRQIPVPSSPVDPVFRYMCENVQTGQKMERSTNFLSRRHFRVKLEMWNAQMPERWKYWAVNQADVDDVIPVSRVWMQRLLDSLQGPLPSGHIGDCVFLLRPMLEDMLNEKRG